ncbi:MAG: alpha/beta hydrolase [Myxococcales bacterium]|nr:alpha/beta hydrolase [Myxococcales bacterium]
MPWVLLAFGLACALASVISIMPPRWPGAATLVAWPIGWLVSELPLHQLGGQLGVGVALILGGGAAAWPGWVGVAGVAVSLTILRHHLIIAARTTGVIERALGDALGRDYHDRIAPAVRATYDPTTPWRAILFPWPRRPRDVDRTVSVAYGDEPRQRLDVYRRADADAAPRPVFVYVHGGGWVVGDKRHQGLLTVHELARAGWVCVSINYRLSPRATFPDHLIDVKRALAWVRGHVAEHGGDPRFVMIGGGSAGAHLASLAAVTANDPRYQPGFEQVDTAVAGCVAYYGVYDFADRAGTFRHRAFRELLLARIVIKRPLAEHEAYEAASPHAQLARTGAATPPMMVIHGTRDNLVPVAMARAFVGEARARGALVAYAELPGAHHAFELFSSLRSVVVVHGVHRFCQAIYSRWRVAHPDRDR